MSMSLFETFPVQFIPKTPFNPNISPKAPAVDWTKSIGVPDMGATFGVVARNELNVDVGKMTFTVEVRIVKLV